MNGFNGVLGTGERAGPEFESRMVHAAKGKVH